MRNSNKENPIESDEKSEMEAWPRYRKLGCRPAKHRNPLRTSVINHQTNMGYENEKGAIDNAHALEAEIEGRNQANPRFWSGFPKTTLCMALSESG
jgi:hypothetical protein